MLRRLNRIEALEPRQMLASDWQNSALAYDVDRSQTATPLDALLIINELNVAGPHAMPQRPIAVSNSAKWCSVMAGSNSSAPCRELDAGVESRLGECCDPPGFREIRRRPMLSGVPGLSRRPMPERRHAMGMRRLP